MNQGWIKLHRALLDNALWKDCNVNQKAIMITLLLMANHQENEWMFKGKKYTVKPGQFITSIPSISDASGCTPQVVRTCLLKLEKHNFLTCESTNKNRLINIENWGKYQHENSEPNRQPNRHLTGKEQAPNRHLTSNKNERMKDNKYIYIDGDKKPIRVNYNSVQEYWEALRDWEIKNGALGIINISKPENEIKQNNKTKSLDEWYKENPMPLLQKFQDKKEFTEQFKNWTKRKNEFKEKMNE